MAIASDLPVELVMYILSWLPVKSLMRFKCVCQSWCSLFNTPSFIAKHLNNNRDNGCLFLKRIDERNLKNYFYSLLSYEALEVVANLDFPLAKEGRTPDIRIVGCCNGIICAYHDYKVGVVLWNPATREVKILPQSYVPHQRHTLDDDNDARIKFGGPIGFGFDAKANDYKVVHLIVTNILETLYQIEIYDLSADSWRKSDAIIPGVVRIETFRWVVPYVNGKFSWLARDEFHHEIIFSFDLSKEACKTTPLPDFCAADDQEWDHWMNSLKVLNESLALIHYPFIGINNMWEIWVLNEYGVKESWTKLYMFGHRLELMHPSGFWKNSHMLVQSIKAPLALLNMVTLETRGLLFDKSSIYTVVFYKESLIRLNGFSVSMSPNERRC